MKKGDGVEARSVSGVRYMTGIVTRVASNRSWVDIKWSGGWSKRQPDPDEHFVRDGQTYVFKRR